MDDIKESGSSPGVWYLLGGLAVGAAAGLLFAPKKGSESRDDLASWGRRNRTRTKSLLARFRGATNREVSRNYAESEV